MTESGEGVLSLCNRTFELDTTYDVILLVVHREVMLLLLNVDVILYARKPQIN